MGELLAHKTHGISGQKFGIVYEDGADPDPADPEGWKLSWDYRSRCVKLAGATSRYSRMAQTKYARSFPPQVRAAVAVSTSFWPHSRDPANAGEDRGIPRTQTLLCLRPPVPLETEHDRNLTISRNERCSQVATLL